MQSHDLHTCNQLMLLNNVALLFHFCGCASIHEIMMGWPYTSCNYIVMRYLNYFYYFISATKEGVLVSFCLINHHNYNSPHTHTQTHSAQCTIVPNTLVLAILTHLHHQYHNDRLLCTLPKWQSYQLGACYIAHN